MQLSIKTLRTPSLINKAAADTCLQGYLRARYDQIVALLGEPSRRGLDKTKFEWVLDIGGTAVTVYDYKDPRRVEDIDVWHVGGKGQAAVVLLTNAIGVRHMVANDIDILSR